MDRDKDAVGGEGSEVSFAKMWTEERECYEEIAEYIKEVNEILDFIKPFPRDRFPDPGQTVSRSSSTDSDHLGNLIKLVEQLKELKEKDSKMNERTQYLKDLKKLRERKKLLKYEAEVGTSGHCSQEEKSRSSMPFRKTSRGRSKSVNIEEIRRGRFPEEELTRRKMSAGSQKPDKSKVSKWTKVKEAFRWEKASVDGKVSRREDVHYLQVPLDKTPESLSDSPLSGQVSGSSSVGAPSTICLAVSSGYSGEHSSEGHSTSSGYGMDLPPPPPPLPTEEDFLMLPLIQDLSSSSSSEKLDELITYSELLAKGNDLAVDSFEGAFHPAEDLESRRSKSLDGDAVLQHLSKDSLTFPKKTHKTAWGKVKDIIQTRKDSLKKKQKKRTGEPFSSQSGLDLEGQEDPSSPEDKPKEPNSPKPRIELTESPEEVVASHAKPTADDSVAKRRLTPVLTITLPSTEELRSISSAEGDTHKPSVPEEAVKPISDNVEFIEDIPKYEKSKTVHYHHFSKWSKVKRAFLTNPSRSSESVPEANSVPSSPNKQMSFFSDVESDELSSGDWTDYKTNPQEKRTLEAESPGSVFSDEIHKHYLALNNKLTQEFDQKMREWERLKSETKTKPEGLQKQKSEDWGKMPRAATRQRESMAIPLPKLEELSPEFKKKLDEWKKIKKSQTISAVPGTSPKDEAQGQNFKMRIGEWQRWRPRGNHKMTKSEQSEEFAKKLEEWQRIKGTVRRSRSQSDRGKDEGNRTPSPSLRRKSSKKKTGSGKSSGTESLGGSLKEKDGRSSRKQQKEKDMQWLEKELHKIERGKMRLEREKEKFLEREARLEKMKRTMGTTSPTEILVKTPTGFFRFEGISQKFQKKLYEWEKARGIAPEASTFALLEEYASRTDRDDIRSNGMSLQRSKSMGSVIEVSSIAQNLPHHPSSLSLNDVDDLDVTGMGESRASSDPTLGQEEDEPQAIIVDVEDVVEETAALMADVPEIRSEVPVYSYAPSEVTQLIDSSGSENETEIQILGQTVKPEDPEPTDTTCRYTL
ncbi:UNVERIFIED_CONTAM: hypothetical protein PYX00_003170 [Menopon gallinae]|uniref:Uncharacterized protein n=1 Tax=Menopon gallinae TaxID=328185 RepID=A0AAW2I0K8_9NEOP